MEDKLRIKYYSNVTRFSNVRTFLALIRTCAVFVGLAIYLKNRYIFLLVVGIMFFGCLEYILINKKLRENKVSTDLSTYNNIVLIYCLLFCVIFILFIFKPPF